MTTSPAKADVPVRGARLAACAAFIFAACIRPSDDTGVDVSTAEPTIVTASAACEEARAEWSFAVTTDAWTGNGQVVLSADGDYVEKHAMYSTSAAADGTSDKLALSLDVVPDWRDVSLGSTTVFNCDEPGLTGILRVWTRKGDSQADCRVFGESPERWSSWDAGVSCAVPLDEP